MHFPSQWKTYSCQRCKWDFLPLITNRNSALTASRLQSKQQQRVATDQIPSSSKSPAKLQTDPPLRLLEGRHKQRFTDSREVSTYCCKEKLRLSHQVSGARHSLHAGDNLELGPKQISAADQVFQVRYLNIKPTQISAQLFSTFVGFTPQFPLHTVQCGRGKKTPNFQTHINWQKAPSLTQFLKPSRFQIYAFLLSSLHRGSCECAATTSRQAVGSP